MPLKFILFHILLSGTVFSLFLLAPCASFAKNIVLGGDVTLNYHIKPDQKRFFTDKARKYLDDAPLFIWNAEFSGDSRNKKTKRFVFSGPLPNLSDMRFKNGVAMVSNNHSLDGGQEGFADLMKALAGNGIPVTGVKNPVRTVVESGGRRYHIFSASPMTSGNAFTSSYGDVLEELKFLKKGRNDFVIVNLHEGIEGTTRISEAQRQRALELARLDADVISFTHTHTYIDPEKIGNSLVVWGLGNFIFGGNSGWRDRNDVRVLEIDPETLAWKWVRGKTGNYVFDIE